MDKSESAADFAGRRMSESRDGAAVMLLCWRPFLRHNQQQGLIEESLKYRVKPV